VYPPSCAVSFKLENSCRNYRKTSVLSTLLRTVLKYCRLDSCSVRLDRASSLVIHAVLLVLAYETEKMQSVMTQGRIHVFSPRSDLPSRCPGWPCMSVAEGGAGAGAAAEDRDGGAVVAAVVALPREAWASENSSCVASMQRPRRGSRKPTRRTPTRRGCTRTT